MERFVGKVGVVQKEIELQDTAVLYGAKDLPEFLATPAYVALMIQAATQAVSEELKEEETTVGVSMSFVHEQPSLTGMLITMKATVERVEDRKIFFKIEAYDEVGQIGYGTHERLLVHRSSLKRKALDRTRLLDWKGK